MGASRTQTVIDVIQIYSPSQLGLYVELMDARRAATVSSNGSVDKYTGTISRRSLNGDFAGSNGDTVNKIKSYITISIIEYSDTKGLTLMLNPAPLNPVILTAGSIVISPE